MTKFAWGQVCAGSIGWNIVTVFHLLEHKPESPILMPFNVAFLILTIVSLVMVKKVKE